MRRGPEPAVVLVASAAAAALLFESLGEALDMRTAADLHASALRRLKSVNGACIASVHVANVTATAFCDPGNLLPFHVVLAEFVKRIDALRPTSKLLGTGAYPLVEPVGAWVASGLHTYTHARPSVGACAWHAGQGFMLLNLSTELDKCVWRGPVGSPPTLRHRPRLPGSYRR